MKGKDLQKAVIELAHHYRWWAVHNPSVETKQGWRTALAADSKGFPDLLLFRDRAIAIEVKGVGARKCEIAVIRASVTVLERRRDALQQALRLGEILVHAVPWLDLEVRLQ